MSTDYIVFIHGVNVRNKEDYEKQVNQMFQKIKDKINNPSRTLKPVTLFWGNVADSSTRSLRHELESSAQWDKFWFKKLRTDQFLPFVGDAALYLSRFVSSEIVRQIADQAICQIGLSLEQLTDLPDKGDRLHLVTHSWGTVVLFDILFASRWDNNTVDDQSRQLVENIRRGFFGVGAGEEKSYGIPLASIHTMGSPIALFNLINIGRQSSFDFTPKLKEFLEALHSTTNKPLPWKNYAHPGDPIAYPLESIIPTLLSNLDENLVDIEDIMSPTSWLGNLAGQSILPVINGGTAHGSYWTERKVAKKIGEVIRSTQK
ncbi:hypothetical protein B9G53_12010 [Pseudanabaena sp. SR411]|uniref:hypothetical protein n=1 Tax=Pseudanabaena sp. SR411 TaxID=1980935 RepID=UPI000B980AE2|nr:hypothetical protein [Pseudanabaena sp. SR411]OYQ64422.1 hypothetical protein B9G53_12010 [Pseudanabaena sp. SR411]